MFLWEDKNGRVLFIWPESKSGWACFFYFNFVRLTYMALKVSKAVEKHFQKTWFQLNPNYVISEALSTFFLFIYSCSRQNNKQKVFNLFKYFPFYFVWFCLRSRRRWAKLRELFQVLKKQNKKKCFECMANGDLYSFLGKSKYTGIQHWR
jgi:hypothetical protein